MATQADIDAFLKKFCAAVDAHGLTLWPTAKNNVFLLATGFTNEDVETIVKSLNSHCYSSGPEPDDDAGRPKGDVWKFAPEYAGYELYVKLKLHHGAPVAECLSCHEAEGEMRQPIRRQRRR